MLAGQNLFFSLSRNLEGGGQLIPQSILSILNQSASPFAPPMRWIRCGWRRVTTCGG